MLSRSLRRALLETRSQLPPTFLLPWTANLSTVSRTIDTPREYPPPTMRGSKSRAPLQGTQSMPRTNRQKNRPTSSNAATATLGQMQQSLEKLRAPPKPSSSTTKSNGSHAPMQLSQSVRDLLPILQAQTPHYITAHIHGFPYLLTEGDTVRLPFLMDGVEPGDVVRLNRAINLGSRDLTLKAPAPADKIKSPATSSRLVVDPTSGSLVTHSSMMPKKAGAEAGALAPHFIPHIAKGKHSYVDERLFVCRAVVMGVESEPLRIKEKTKRRQRHVRRVKSKHRYTILKIKELRVKTVDEVEGDWIEEA